ncbi:MULTISPECIES: hypothetical protein [Methylobacterium]|uniref:hypothetical protein n=1 Tax=Methylobacterium TaxID=407 RepID=UPI00272E27C8|nr:hypothetical protein [Methylobacterium sp.]
MTRESADAARLHGLIEQLIEALAAPEPIFRLVERLAKTGGAEETDRTVARLLEYNTDTLARIRAAYTALHKRQRHAGSNDTARARTEALPKLFKAPEDQASSEQARLRPPVDIEPPEQISIRCRRMMRAMPITRVHRQADGRRVHKAAHDAVLGAHGNQYAFF